MGSVATLWALDVAYEVLRGGFVWPRLTYSPSAASVAAVAKAAGAATPFRQAFDLFGSYLSRHIQTIAAGAQVGAKPVGVTGIDSWVTADGATLELVSYGGTGRGLALVVPGLTGDASGSKVAVSCCLEVGLRPVVLHRRGDGRPLTSPSFNLFGNTSDLDEAIQRLRRTSTEPIVLFASSAGTGLVVRYLGEQGPRAPIAAAFLNCPGYDIAVALTRCSWFYDSVFVANLKRHYLNKNKALLQFHNPAAFDRANRAPSIHSFMVAAAPFAGFATLGEYLGASNPMGTARHITVPLLVVNADDDPICTKANVDDNIDMFALDNNAVLVRTSRGGHCAFLARKYRAIYPWAHGLGARFLAAYCKHPAASR